MELTDEELREFSAIWKKAFKEELALGDARHYASQLIELYALLAEPLPSERRAPVSPEPLPCAISSTVANPPRPKTGKSSPSNPSGKR
jgi:hypothetical protein